LERALAGIGRHPIGSGPAQGASIVAAMLAGETIGAGVFFVLLQFRTENFSCKTGIYLPCHGPTSLMV
jgi:hypothetical protein